jgi:hypothetical protein
MYWENSNLVKDWFLTDTDYKAQNKLGKWLWVVKFEEAFVAYFKAATIQH